MLIYDISPLVSENMAVFPGDQPYVNKKSLSQDQGDHLDLSSIQTTLHIGSHADAPSHYGLSETIDKVALARYLGLAQVISAEVNTAARIYPKDISAAKILAPRVLFKTKSFPDPNLWNSDFNSLSPELIEFLNEHHVKLVGIDTPSIDPEDSKKLEAHNQVLKFRMSILEGLVLDRVPDGLYQLIALPLRLKGAEASPVRAILIPRDADLSDH